jgi:hypothetical protein
MPVDTEFMNKGETILPKLSWDVLDEAHTEFLKLEPRDAVYKISTRLIRESWNDDSEVSNALGVLLLTWNAAFCRYSILNYPSIEDVINRHRKELNELRELDISELKEDMKVVVKSIYTDFLYALKSKGKGGVKNRPKVSYSPVSTAKSLHLLCPRFFPLWDNRIAKGYGCHWENSKNSFEDYWKFMNINYEQVASIRNQSPEPESLKEIGILKLIDEYNYVHFTLKAI